MLTVDAAAALPASVAEAKAFLRIDHVHEDALIAGLLRSALALCEAFTGQVLLARGCREMAAAGDWVRLAATPVRSVGDAMLVPVTGAETLLTEGVERDIDANGDGWVRAVVPGGGRVRVSYVAGIADDWNGVAEPLRQGMLRLVAHLHAHRDAAGDPGPPAAAPQEPRESLPAAP